MTTQIARWGNSHGVRLTKDLLETAGISVDDELRVTAENGKIIIEKNIRHKTLEERAGDFGGKLGPYEEYDWGEPVGREAW